MLHFFGILTPPSKRDGDQRRFFSDEPRLSHAERDVVMLNSGLQVERDEREDGNPMSLRFVSLLAPPFL